MTSVGSTQATSGTALAKTEVSAAAQLACLLEASAPKPGNVSPGRHFGDARYEDFLASAVAIGVPLAAAGNRPLGETILDAVNATGQWTRSNTNLGIILLLAPLARAALHGSARGSDTHGESDLRQSLRRVLDETSIDDASHVYAAIRQAAPGGLGGAETQDVADEPTLPLVEVMRLAADRDGIASEYASAFDVTFRTGAPTLVRARADGLSWSDAVVETFLTLLASHADTHVTRRRGIEAAAHVSRLAVRALADGGVRSVAGWRAIDAMDVSLRNFDNSLNPGTTADLTAAAIFVVLLDGGWQRENGGRDVAVR